jgi:hypothetical protein
VVQTRFGNAQGAGRQAGFVASNFSELGWSAGKVGMRRFAIREPNNVHAAAALARICNQPAAAERLVVRVGCDDH